MRGMKSKRSLECMVWLCKDTPVRNCLTVVWSFQWKERGRGRLLDK